MNLLELFEMRAASSEAVPLYGVCLSPEQLGAVATSTGESVENIASSLLSSRCGLLPRLATVADLDPRRCGGVAASEWASVRGSRYCASCLGSDGVWLIDWRLAWTIACRRHGRLLVDRCFGCRRLPGKGNRRALPNFRELVARPGRCQNPAGRDGRRGDPRCGAILSEHPLVVDASTLELSAQERLDFVAGQGFGPLWGQVLPAEEWYLAFRNVVALVNALAHPEDVAASPGPASAFADWVRQRDRERAKGEAALAFTVPPRSIEHAAAVVPAALRLMTAPTGADGMDRLVRRCADRGRTRWRSLPERLGIGSVVSGAWKDATRPMVGFSAKARIGRSAAGYGFEARHVPQVLDDRAYNCLAPLIPGTLPRVGRLFAGLSLVRVAHDCSWATAAALLGLDPQVAKRVVNAVRPRIADHDALWLTVQRLAADWPSSGLVDFGARRDWLAGVTEIDAVPFTAMSTAAGVAPRSGTTRRNCAVWLWQDFAGGYLRCSPALVAARSTGTSWSSAVEVYRRFRLWLPSPLAEELCRWAEKEVGA